MMIFRSDDLASPTKGGKNALQSRVSCKQISRDDRSEPSTLFLVPIARPSYDDFQLLLENSEFF